ncbi:MAG: SDR family oxidoreductase [Bacteroidia bacterium]|nr:SDR family oxidoreductase [Bacteroidia bacterium]
MKNVAIVTGGARGIGLAITKRLIESNYIVIVSDILEGLVDTEKIENSDCHYFKCDITKKNDIIQLFNFVKATFDKIDLLVNNAGIIKDNMIWNMPEEDFDKVIDVNLKGTWLMCKQAAIMMKAQNFGRIVNISSRAWLGNKGQSNYSASKAGVIGLTRVLALELGKYNICVNAVAPGLINTPLTQNLKPDVLESLINAQPTNNIGQPEDVANAVMFLGSEITKFITGQVIYVDGGKSISSNMF